MVVELDCRIYTSHSTVVSSHRAGMARQTRDSGLPHNNANSATPLPSSSMMMSTRGTSSGLLFSSPRCIASKRFYSPSLPKVARKNGQPRRQLGTRYPRPHHWFSRRRTNLPLPPHHYPRVDRASILVR